MGTCSLAGFLGCVFEGLPGPPGAGQTSKAHPKNAARLPSGTQIKLPLFYVRKFRLRRGPGRPAQRRVEPVLVDVCIRRSPIDLPNPSKKLTVGFLKHGFWAGRKSPNFGVWAAPRPQKPFQKVGGEAPHLLESILRTPGQAKKLKS